MAEGTCPKCGNITIDEVCQVCVADPAGNTHGAQLRAKEQVKAQNRMSMWRNRVSLIKQARTFMEGKSYSQAAILYEKYLKILEVIYDKKSGELTPDLFKNKARQSELTVITSVYWDLVRIYDSGNYGERLGRTIVKLLEFSPHSTIGKQLSRDISIYMKTAKHPVLFKDLAQRVGVKRRPCFIATAAFESDKTPEVLSLKKFRDDVLINYWWGRRFIDIYYFISPSIARAMHQHSWSKRPVRGVLRFLLEKVV